MTPPPTARLGVRKDELLSPAPHRPWGSGPPETLSAARELNLLSTRMPSCIQGISLFLASDDSPPGSRAQASLAALRARAGEEVAAEQAHRAWTKCCLAYDRAAYLLCAARSRRAWTSSTSHAIAPSNFCARAGREGDAAPAAGAAPARGRHPGEARCCPRYGRGRGADLSARGGGGGSGGWGRGRGRRWPRGCFAFPERRARARGRRGGGGAKRGGAAGAQDQVLSPASPHHFYTNSPKMLPEPTTMPHRMEFALEEYGKDHPVYRQVRG